MSTLSTNNHVCDGFVITTSSFNTMNEGTSFSELDPNGVMISHSTLFTYFEDNLSEDDEAMVTEYEASVNIHHSVSLTMPWNKAQNILRGSADSGTIT